MYVIFYCKYINIGFFLVFLLYVLGVFKKSSYLCTPNVAFRIVPYYNVLI